MKSISCFNRRPTLDVRHQTVTCRRDTTYYKLFRSCCTVFSNYISRTIKTIFTKFTANSKSMDADHEPDLLFADCSRDITISNQKRDNFRRVAPSPNGCHGNSPRTFVIVMSDCRAMHCMSTKFVADSSSICTLKLGQTDRQTDRQT